MDEGYIKFNCNWINSAPLPNQKIAEINSWRNMLYIHGLIGAYPNGIGFGNISIRNNDNSFLITGTATGNLKKLNKNHYVEVNDYDFTQNSLTCTGPVKASSESLSHAVIYECSPETIAVIHVHNLELWNKLINKVPTTKIDALYGTIEMTEELKNLFKEPVVPAKKTIVLGGHREGIITFGKTLDEAGNILMDLYQNLNY